MKSKGSAKKKEKTLLYECPVCGKSAASGAFLCTGCDPEKWVHIKCGGYTYSQLKQLKMDELRCNNCKKLSVDPNTKTDIITSTPKAKSRKTKNESLVTDVTLTDTPDKCMRRVIAEDCIFSYEENKENFTKRYKRKGFAKALQEIEDCPTISNEENSRNNSQLQDATFTTNDKTLALGESIVMDETVNCRNTSTIESDIVADKAENNESVVVESPSIIEENERTEVTGSTDKSISDNLLSSAEVSEMSMLLSKRVAAIDNNKNDESRPETMRRIIDNYLNEVLSEDIALKLIGKLFSDRVIEESTKNEIESKVHKELQFCYTKFHQLDNLEKFVEKEPTKAELLRQKKEKISKERDSVIKEFNELSEELVKATLAYQEKVNIVQNELFSILDEQELAIKQKNDCLTMILPTTIAPIGYHDVSVYNTDQDDN